MGGEVEAKFDFVVEMEKLPIVDMVRKAWIKCVVGTGSEIEHN